ncbi:MAG: Rieske (2Fe-2S) protein [Actinomycetota bacterium]
MKTRLLWVGLLAVFAILGVQVASDVIEDARWIRITDLTTLQNEEVVYSPEHEIFLVSNGDRALALSAVSPHRPDLGELVLFCPSSGMFEAAHGEKFDRFGSYYGGPAPGGLDRFAVKVEGGEVYVDLDRRMTGPGRGASEALEAKGDFCGEKPIEKSPGFASVPERH